MSILVLGLDPGKTTGWAKIRVDEKDASRTITPVQWGNTKDMQLIEIRQHIEDVDWIVYEKWVTFDKHARAGKLSNQTVPAEQVIGAMKTLLRLRTTPYEIHHVMSGVKPVGYGYSGMKYVPGKKGMHWQDALAHAVYFAVNKLHALPPAVGQT